MEIFNADRSKILVEALPYIQKYTDKVVVIKYGGNAMINSDLKSAVMKDIVLLSLVGIKVVLVHGGGPEITDMLSRVNKESKFVDGLRYTDEETMEIVQMVLAGKVNKDLVAQLEKSGGKAVGLCGLDGGMIKAVKHTEKDLGLVGDITEVDTKPITVLLSNGYIPVISTVAGGECAYNINADLAASKIASVLGAQNLILMTDIRGLLRDKDDDSTLISSLKASEVPALKMQGIIRGGMIPKVDCCVEAVRRGVSSAAIIDGRVPHAILSELLTDEGIGTMITA